MRHLKEMKRPRLATVLAGLALMIALGGSATAASGLINGSKIKNNTITTKKLKNQAVNAKKIKNKSITKNKLTPATVTSLKGNQGVPGPKGDPGENGIVSPIYQAFGSTNLPANTELGVGVINVPAGKYLIEATARVFSTGTANMGCIISTNAGGGESESSTWSSPAASSRTTLPIQLVTETSTVTQITLGCHPGASNGSASGTIVATPVQ